MVADSVISFSRICRLSGCHDFTNLLDNCFATLLHRVCLEEGHYGTITSFASNFQPNKEYLHCKHTTTVSHLQLFLKKSSF